MSLPCLSLSLSLGIPKVHVSLECLWGHRRKEAELWHRRDLKFRLDYGSFGGGGACGTKVAFSSTGGALDGRLCPLRGGMFIVSTKRDKYSVSHMRYN